MKEISDFISALKKLKFTHSFIQAVFKISSTYALVPFEALWREHQAVLLLA
jgi:hypothetical protein